MAPVISPEIWITREGQHLEIKKMASSHLLSTIHFIERSRFNNVLEVYTDAIRNEINMDDAVTYYAQWPIQYENLVKEAQRRNLLWRNVPGIVKAKKK